MTVTKINSDGSVALPVEALDQLDLRPGDELLVEVHGKRIALRPQMASRSQASVTAYFGAAQGVFRTPEAVDAFVRAERGSWR